MFQQPTAESGAPAAQGAQTVWPSLRDAKEQKTTKKAVPATHGHSDAFDVQVLTSTQLHASAVASHSTLHVHAYLNSFLLQITLGSCYCCVVSYLCPYTCVPIGTAWPFTEQGPERSSAAVQCPCQATARAHQASAYRICCCTKQWRPRVSPRGRHLSA